MPIEPMSRECRAAARTVSRTVIVRRSWLQERIKKQNVRYNNYSQYSH